MKFVHTADWQIGMKAAHAGGAGARVREERVKAAARVVELARREGADFLIIAGDTFEHNAIDRVLVQRTADILAGFGRPVFVIPGNHDPAVPGSVWEHAAWKGAPNVRVLLEAAPVAMEGGEILPCPLNESRSPRDPTAWIGPAGSGGIRVGLAHGTVEGILSEEPEYPIPRDAAARSELDYLALGHWHSETRFPGPDGAVRMAYSGTHETTRFGERESGNALLVEIAAPGQAPVIQSLRTGALRWEVIERDLSIEGVLREVRESVEAIGDPGAALLEVRLRGLLFAADQHELGRIRELIGARFLFGRMDDSALRPAPGDQNWIETLPEGVLRETAARLRDLAGPGYEGARPEGAAPEVAAQALTELYNLAVEVRG